ncbi:PASTA domain-containing protein [Amycolatopsis alkalitolerans]|uniref:PASTA domain-containing protein n=1 Tax=Amycolatopsis alkalitolerans TaxID=2547244 RepID=A0A5C4LT11_9PSEU|nr:PASTA domain-containing protein [Amycolatopsis alkalitolerans]TNC20050.1 PASTA domain-containing protein [Amycolatopsis alkalitolerans]
MRGHRPVTEVPDVVGLGAEDACEIVRRAGLVPRGPEGEPEPASGVVVAQAPIATAGAEQGSDVVLWTQLGPRAGAEATPPTPTESALLPA